MTLWAIERIAWALCRANCAHIGGPEAETLVRGTPNWKFHMRDAETAFTAMPTVSGMLRALEDVASIKVAPGPGQEWTHERAADAYSSALDMAQAIARTALGKHEVGRKPWSREKARFHDIEMYGRELHGALVDVLAAEKRMTQQSRQVLERAMERFVAAVDLPDEENATGEDGA